VKKEEQVRRTKNEKNAYAVEVKNTYLTVGHGTDSMRQPFSGGHAAADIE
jgi:hypothetical protein